MKTKNFYISRIAITISVIYFLVFQLQAQEVTTFIHKHNYYIELRNIMETRDGNIIINCPLFGIGDQSLYDIGTTLYKVTPQGELLDSLFIEDKDMTRFIIERNPLDEENNILVKIYRDFDNISSKIRILHFDDNLEILEDNMYPFQDTIIDTDTYYLDPYNDIIADYWMNGKHHISRIGLDGVLKDTKQLPTINPNYWQVRHIGLYNKTPLEYCLWGSKRFSNSVIYNIVLDSLLNFKSETMFNSMYDGGSSEQIMYVNDNEFILSSTFDILNPLQHGVHLSKFDKNQELVKSLLFLEDEGEASPFPICVEQVADGGMYYSYVTTAFGKQVAVVKLDDDFNVLWKRYCLQSGTGFHWGKFMRVLENGDVAVGGFDSFTGPDYFGIFLIIINNQGVTTPEMEQFVKPYLIYPNPCKDNINIAISPDIAFEKAELFDLSGRLIKTMESDFENIDVTDLVVGTYILKLKVRDGNEYSEKIIKN